MQAIEIDRAERTHLRAKPVVLQGIRQEALRELTAECDAVVNGVTLRLPAGCVIAVHGGGSSGAVGSLMCDLEFLGRDGRTYRATRGMQLSIPAR